MNYHSTPQPLACVPEPPQEPWGPLDGIDPVSEYHVLAQELQECFPDVPPQQLDRMIVREMALYGGLSVAVITQAMLEASPYLAAGSVSNIYDYVERTVAEVLQQRDTDNAILGWG